MAKKPDTPCAGECGRLLWSGNSSLPEGKRMCRPCRSHRRATSPPRRQVRQRQPDRPCASCPAPVPASRRYCPDCAGARRAAHYRRKNAVRRGAAKVGRSLSITELGERDGWRCHLCGRRVNSALRSPHPKSPSFDHLIPVSDGGTDAPENLQLAHRRCNSSRGNRGSVQLMLVG